MYGWSVVLLFIALAAAVLGFWVLPGPAATTAKVLCIVFLAVFVLRLIIRAMRKTMRGSEPQT